MTNDDAKKDFKQSWDHSKEAAADAVEGVKDTARNVSDEVKEIADGEDK